MAACAFCLEALSLLVTATLHSQGACIKELLPGYGTADIPCQITGVTVTSTNDIGNRKKVRRHDIEIERTNETNTDVENDAPMNGEGKVA